MFCGLVDERGDVLKERRSAAAIDDTSEHHVHDVGGDRGGPRGRNNPCVENGMTKGGGGGLHTGGKEPLIEGAGDDVTLMCGILETTEDDILKTT
jgi:hypothetical protein